MSSRPLSELRAGIQAAQQEAEAGFREFLIDVMEGVQERWNRRAPILTGEFRADLRPHGPGSDGREKSGSPAGRAEVEAAMRGWTIGEPCGHRNNHPAAVRLTARRPKGWPVQIVRDSVSAARRG
ncbi:MAG: hypothetical protein AAGN46_01255 [Acidobacteriota bacterium]